MSIRDSNTLENCDEIWVHLDDLGLLDRVKNFKPSGSKILYMLFWTERMKDNNLLLNSDIDSEFLILISKENQSFKVEGKKGT